MIDIYVLDGNLNPIGIIDAYTSLIWANRYDKVGDCELYIQAVSEAIELLKNGNYLMRLDDEMVCKIKAVELDTHVENGDFLIVTGHDVKSFLNQRIIWGTMSKDGNEEDFIRDMVNKSLGYPNLSARQLKKPNGERMFYLGDKANFSEVIQEQVSYANVGEKVRETCARNNWGYKVILSDGALYFKLYKGSDKSDSVIFSKRFENLVSSKYIQDETNLGNVALVAGEGEGSERARNVSGYQEGVDRYEIFVDAKDISKTITWSDLITLYPTTDQGGHGHIYVTSPQQAITYMMDIINIAIVDANQLTELQANYPNGQVVTIDGIQYYQAYNIIIADLTSDTPQENDSVVLRDVVYEVYLLNRGYAKLAEHGRLTLFEGIVVPDATFKYKEDYSLGDLVTVENEYGMSVEARIVEVIETVNENGYNIEPRFEFMEVN